MFKNFLNKNLSHNIDYEKDDDYSCNNDCDDYCRCYTINYVNVNDSISNRFGLYECLYKQKSNIISLQDVVAQRFVSNMFSTECFEASWGAGYYGDELDSIVYKGNIEQYENFNNLTTKEKLHLTLINEYKFVLPQLEIVEEWELAKINRNDIFCDSVKTDEQRVSEYKSHLERTIRFDNKNLDFLKFYAPLVLFNEKSQKYKIYDGHHRFKSLPEPEKQKLGKKKKKKDTAIFEKIWVIRPKQI